MHVINLDPIRKMLVRHEGLRLRAYKCSAGKTTIGVGRNLDDVGITEEESYLLLDNDIARVIDELQESLPFFNGLDEIRQYVLIDMCFNLGLAGLLRFRNMLRAVKAGDWEQAGVEMMDSLWARQVKGRAVTLRRMMETGKDA